MTLANDAFHERAHPNLFERIEAIAGTLLLGTAAGSLITGSLWAIRTGRANDGTNLPILTTVSILFVAAYTASAIFLVRAMATARSPMLVGIAEQHPPLTLFKGAVVMWWLWHFLSMSAAADAFWQEYQLRYTSLTSGMTPLLIRVAVTFSASAAANLCLLLAAGAAGLPDPTLHNIYRLRFALDAFVAAAILILQPAFLMLFRVPFMFLFRIAFPK